MAENKKTPKIRFKGFTDGWKQRKLGELYEKVSRKNDMTYGKDKIISVANMYYKTDSYITKADYLLTYNIFKLGDIAFEGNKSKNFAHGRFVENTIGNGIVSHVFEVFKPIMPKYDLIFWKYAINNERLMGNILIRSTKASTMMTNLVSDDFLAESFYVPKYEEQNKIGAYLKNLDNLITLHQRKYDKLQNIKKACLEKMFPKNGADVPEIRFKGFTDPWQQRKLVDTLISLQNNTLSRAELCDEKGVAKNVHYGDVLIKFGEYLDVNKAELPMIADESVVTKYKASYLQNGDVIVADTAEDETVGKCSEIACLNDEIILSGLHTIPYRPLLNFAFGYLGYYMNSNSYHSQLLPLMQGTKVTSISKSAMKNTVIFFPISTDEQTKIGDFFKHLDNLITLQERQLTKLKNIKKSCLEKMFV